MQVLTQAVATCLERREEDAWLTETKARGAAAEAEVEPMTAAAIVRARAEKCIFKRKEWKGEGDRKWKDSCEVLYREGGCRTKKELAKRSSG